MPAAHGQRESRKTGAWLLAPVPIAALARLVTVSEVSAMTYLDNHPALAGALSGLVFGVLFYLGV